MGDWRELDRDQLEKHLDHECKKRGITRRDLMKGGAGMAAALGLGWLAAACGGDDDEAAAPAEPAEPAAPPSGEPAAPPADVPKFTGTVRVTGLGVDLIDPIKAAGEAALGFTLAFDVTDSVTMVQRAITQPGSFDVFSGYTYQYNQAFQSGNFHHEEIAKLTNWGQMSKLITQGKVDPASTTCTYGDGDAPFRTLYIDPTGGEGGWPSSSETPSELQGTLVSWVDEATGQTVGDEPLFTIGPPNNFNMDSMGYNADVIAQEPEAVDWPELFNASYQGRVALLNDPGIGLQDAGNAAKASGMMTFGSLGNMTKEEIDGLVSILLDLKAKNHFRAFWTTFDESVNFMASGEVVIESMWSPAVALLVAQGLNVRYAAPPSGFRGWCSTHSISKEAEADPSLLQACYDYINWWHSGEPGAIMMRQGYYNAVQETSRQFVEPEEYAFWIDGEAAAKDLPGITGQVGDIKAGQVRDGGSFVDRACNYSSWNSYFEENEYQIQRWNEFLAA
jgi:putative spermidine/putrescine transport system substrate-binding protein